MANGSTGGGKKARLAEYRKAGKGKASPAKKRGKALLKGRKKSSYNPSNAPF